MSRYQTDVVIIGAGPVGLFAIFELGMLKIKAHIVDTLEMIGGQCSALYPEKPIYDIPAHPNINASDLIQKLDEQSTPFKPEFHLNQRVDKLEKINYGYRVTTSKNIIIEAKTILIAAGCGAFGPNRPPLENLGEYENKSVFYLVKRKEDFRGKKVVIAGGGDSAVDWAIVLADIASSVSIVHRRPKFRAAPESEAKLKKLSEEGKIDLVVPYQLHSLEGDNGYLKNVIASDLDGNKKTIEADYLLPFFGLAMELGPIANWGLNLDTNRIIVNPATMETNALGIFAIGDINYYPGKLKLIVSGFAEAAMAAHAIYPIIYPDKALHFEYSTTKGVP